MRDDCEPNETHKIMLCNRAMEKLTGLTDPHDEERFFNTKIFSISNKHVEQEDPNNMSFESYEEQQKVPQQTHSLWDIY